MNEVISHQTFLILIICNMALGIGLIVLSWRSFRTLTKKQGLRKKVLDDGTILFVDEAGITRITIPPNPPKVTIKGAMVKGTNEERIDDLLHVEPNLRVLMNHVRALGRGRKRGKSVNS